MNSEEPPSLSLRSFFSSLGGELGLGLFFLACSQADRLSHSGTSFQGSAKIVAFSWELSLGPQPPLGEGCLVGKLLITPFFALPGNVQDGSRLHLQLPLSPRSLDCCLRTHFPSIPHMQEWPDSFFPPGQPDLLRRLSMPSSASSMAPVPNAQVPRLRVLVAASREEEAEWLGGEPGSLPGIRQPHIGWVHTERGDAI